MSEFLNPAFTNVEPYTPGEQPQDRRYIKLNTNESPFPPAPAVLKAVNEEEALNLRLYSDPNVTPLKKALAETYSVSPEEVFVSNGSDEALDYAFAAFGVDGISFPDITYGFYEVLTGYRNLTGLPIPLKKDFSIDFHDYLGLHRMIVLANPNAPTGLFLQPDEIESIVRANPDRVVLIDEAYIDFGGVSAVPLTRKYPNLLVVQTFSKSRSLAGARVGFAIGSRELILDLERLRNASNPYNINRISMAAAVAALSAPDYYRKNCGKIIENRDYTTKLLESLGFEVLPSLANFVFARRSGTDGEKLYQKLKEKGVLVRHFTTDSIRDYNRITIGSKEEMETFGSVLAGILEENS